METNDTQYVALRCFLFSQGGERVKVTTGEVCPPLSDGRLSGLLRLGWVAPADAAPVEGDGEAGGDNDGADWKQQPVAALELDERIGNALAAAELATIEDLLAYGSEHGTLTKLDGIGESSEKAIQEAITKLAP